MRLEKTSTFKAVANIVSPLHTLLQGHFYLLCILWLVLGGGGGGGVELELYCHGYSIFGSGPGAPLPPPPPPPPPPDITYWVGSGLL